MGNLIWRIALIGIIAFAIRGAYHVATDIRDAQRSSNWSSTSGKVIRFVDINCSLMPQEWPDDRIVEYRYVVDGQEYNGNRISFSRRSKWPYQEVKALVSPWQSSPETTVYFDPTNPRLSVLQKGGSNYWNIGFFCLQIIVILCLALLLKLSFQTRGN
jgi:hypothetical protein